MGEMGFMGMNLPEETPGGAGVDTISYCLATMEIGRADSSVAVTMGVNHLVCEVINLYGSEEHKQKYLPILTSGEGIGSFCLSEHKAGSDAQNQKTRAIDGDEYVINGKKAWITNGGFARVFVVTAVTGEDERGRKEITAFLVDTDTQGLILGNKPEHKMGQCASNTVEVTFDGKGYPPQI